MKKINKEMNIIEFVLKSAREKKHWDYFDVAKKINDTNINEKTVKKWEYGLLYPDLNTIYKLSEIYNIPSEELVQARNNSMNKGLGIIHFRLIDWVCYITNISIIFSIMFNFLLVYVIAPIFAFWYFVSCLQFVISTLH